MFNIQGRLKWIGQKVMIKNKMWVLVQIIHDFKDTEDKMKRILSQFDKICCSNQNWVFGKRNFYKFNSITYIYIYISQQWSFSLSITYQAIGYIKYKMNSAFIWMPILKASRQVTPAFCCLNIMGKYLTNPKLGRVHRYYTNPPTKKVRGSGQYALIVFTCKPKTKNCPFATTTFTLISTNHPLLSAMRVVPLQGCDPWDQASLKTLTSNVCITLVFCCLNSMVKISCKSDTW